MGPSIDRAFYVTVINFTLSPSYVTRYKLQVTSYTLQVTRYKLHVTRYTLHVTRYTLQMRRKGKHLPPVT